MQLTKKHIVLNKITALSRSLLMIMILLFVGAGSYAQDTGDEDKTKFLDKINHWFVAYGMSSPDFMQEERLAFKSQAFAEVYVEGIIDHEAWMFRMLNKITQFRYDAKHDPHVLFKVKFTPTDDEINSYTIGFEITESSETGVNLDKIEKDVIDEFIGTKTYAEPMEAASDIEKAVKQALTTLADKLGDKLAPNLMVKYQNEVFWNGHDIHILDSEGNSVELEAVDKEGNPISSAELTWTNADPFESKGVVDMTDISSKTVTLERDNDPKALSVNVTRLGADANINDLLKELIIETLSAKKQQAQDTIVVLKADSVKNLDDIRAQLALLERYNFPLEEATGVTSYVSDIQTLQDESYFNLSNQRKEGFRLLRKRKGLTDNIRRKINVSVFADLIVDEPERIEDLLDELLRNSGRLIARLILGRDSDGQRDAARDIVVDFLNRNLDRIANANTEDTFVEDPLPVIVVEDRSAQPTFNADTLLYVSGNVQFEGRAEFITTMTDYLTQLETPTVMVVNYSQDLGTASFQNRTTGARPVGLPAEYDFITINVVNIPGSVKRVFEIKGTEEVVTLFEGASDYETIQNRATQGIQDGFAVQIFNKLKSVQGTGFLYCKKCEEQPVNINPEIGEAYVGPIGEDVYKCIIATIEVNGGIATQYDFDTRSFENSSQSLSNYVNDESQFMLISKESGEILPCETAESFPANFCDPTYNIINDELEAQMLRELSKCIDDSDFSGAEIIAYETDKEVSYEAIRQAISDQLSNTFFSDGKSAKIGVKLHDAFGKSEFLSTSDVGEENVEIKLLIKVDEINKTIKFKNIAVSEAYLETLVSWLQNKANNRGIEVNVEELREQVLTDIRANETNASFLAKAFQSIESAFNESIGTYVEVVQTSQKVTKSVWNDGQMSKGHWWSGADDRGKWPDYAELNPLIAGPLDGIIDEVTGIPIAIKSFYGIATDDEQRAAFAKIFTKDGIKAVIEGVGKELEDTFNDTEKIQHGGGKTTVAVAAMFFTGGISKSGKGFSLLEELLSEVVDLSKYKKLTAFLDDVRKLKADEFNRLKKQFDEVFNKFAAANVRESLDVLIGLTGRNVFRTKWLPKLHRLKDVPGIDKVIKEMTKGRNFNIGHKFVLEFATDGLNKLNIKRIIKFEADDLDNSLKRIYDIVYEDGVGNIIRAELKNWRTFYPGTIRKQFVRDLNKMTSLGELKWFFKKSDVFKDKSLKDQIIAALTKDGNPVDELENLFEVNEGFSDKIGKIMNRSIADADELVDALSDERVFNKIFQIVE